MHVCVCVCVCVYVCVCMSVCLSVTVCPMGCSLCTGPMNTDCLSCSDGSHFRDTTNKLDSPCVSSCPSDRGVMNQTDQFGRKTCVGEYVTACMSMYVQGRIQDFPRGGSGYRGDL